MRNRQQRQISISLAVLGPSALETKNLPFCWGAPCCQFLLRTFIGSPLFTIFRWAFLFAFSAKFQETENKKNRQGDRSSQFLS